LNSLITDCKYQHQTGFVLTVVLTVVLKFVLTIVLAVVLAVVLTVRCPYINSVTL
jgi:hypothetical protein